MFLEKNSNKKLSDKEKEAIEIIRKYAPKEEIYYLAYSGGKDSDVLLHLARRAGVNFQAIHNFTTIETREQIKHVRKQKNVKIIYPAKTFYQLVEEKGLPTMMKRWCCKSLKHYYGKGKLTMTGVRKEESVARGKRALEYIEYGGKKKDTKIRSVLPIVNFTEKDIWDYIEKYDIETCKLYKMGYKRVGCVGCPLSPKKQRERGYANYPNMKTAIEKSFDKYNARSKEKGSRLLFKNGEEAVKWWLSGLSVKAWNFKNKGELKFGVEKD